MDNSYKGARLWHSDPDAYHLDCSLSWSPAVLLLDHLCFIILSRNELGHLTCVLDGGINSGRRSCSRGVTSLGTQTNLPTNAVVPKSPST